MKKILEEPEPESDTDFLPDTESEPEQETTQETIDDLNEPDTLDIQMIGATPLV